MLIISIAEFQKSMHMCIFKFVVGFNLVNFGFLLLLFGNVCKFERDFYLLFLKLKNTILALDSQTIFLCVLKNYYSSSYNFSFPKVAFFAFKVDHPKLL